MRGIRSTLLPPARPANWYRKHRACASCDAKVLRVKDVEEGSRMTVQHQKKCGVLRSSKGGGESTRRASRKGRGPRSGNESRPLTSSLPLGDLR